jgi:hypothetical protein
MSRYTPQVTEFLVSLGWDEGDLLHRHKYDQHWQRDAAGNRTVGVVPIGSTKANGFDGSRDGTRFILRCENGGSAMKDRMVDSTKPLWKNKVHGWMAEATFRRADETAKQEASRHQAELAKQRLREWATRLLAPYGVTFAEFSLLFQITAHYDQKFPGDTNQIISYEVDHKMSAIGVLSPALRAATNRFNSLPNLDRLTMATRMTRSLIDCGFIKVGDNP